MKYSIIAILALAMTGCAGLPEFLAGSDSDNALGTHKINVDAECATSIDQRTIRGGSNVAVTHDGEGKCSVTISGNKAEAVQKALELLQ